MVRWRYLRVLNARCCCSRTARSEKLSSRASEFSSADARFHATRQARLSFLVCIWSQSPKRVLENANRNSIPQQQTFHADLYWIFTVIWRRRNLLFGLYDYGPVPETNCPRIANSVALNLLGIRLCWIPGRASSRPFQEHQNTYVEDESPTDRYRLRTS